MQTGLNKYKCKEKKIKILVNQATFSFMKNEALKERQLPRVDTVCITTWTPEVDLCLQNDTLMNFSPRLLFNINRIIHNIYPLNIPTYTSLCNSVALGINQYLSLHYWLQHHTFCTERMSPLVSSITVSRDSYVYSLHLLFNSVDQGYHSWKG